MSLTGNAAHERAVCDVQAQVRAVPSGVLRLAKKTSNPFRHRERSSAGLDVSGLVGVIGIYVDACIADVQGGCTYESLVAARRRAQ